MENEIFVLVLKDEDGRLRPMSGIWVNNDAGKMGAEIFLAKPMNAGLVVVKASLREIKEE